MGILVRNETPIYSIRNAKLSFGLNELFSRVDLHIKRGDKICLIGRNGSGKSTLLKVIAGEIEADSAEKFVQPGIKISYMAQENDLSKFSSLREAVLSGLPEDKREINEYKADILIKELDILEDQNPKKASGGECKKASLAMALIGEPDILLLDEPTNHLDIFTIEKLEKTVNSFSGAIIMISHDRTFLEHVSNTTFWLDRGILRYNDKGFKDFENWQEQVIEQEIVQQKYLNKKIEEETEWLHKGVTARRKRNQGRLRRLQDLRKEKKEQIKQAGSVKLEIDDGDVKTKLVIDAKNISKSFDDREIVKNFSLKVVRGDKIGFVGPNGAGKTTLIKLLTKRMEPDSGFVRIGKNLTEAYFDQNRMSLDLSKTLWKTLCEEGDHIYVRGASRHVVSYLKDFLFSPEQANCPVSALSGGEKNRLMLAKALAKEASLLVLDEPTNDLDMDTLDLLQEVLDEYDGTVLIVSHDRSFLDHIATSLIYMEGNGEAIEFIGDYEMLMKTIKEKALKNKTKAQAVEEKSVKKEKVISKKLNFNEQYLLRTLPDKIALLEKEISLMEDKMADPNFYSQSPTEFEIMAKALEAKKSELDEFETKYLELEIKKDEI